MKKFLFLLPFLLLCSIFKSYTQNILFSDSTTISLITCSPGKEVYARFGHSAIRLNDEVTGQDIVFNYGIFDFNTHNFYLKFVKGETDYKLAAYDFIYFLPEYVERNSVVWEQELNLSIEEKRNLIELLLINYEPQNRTYRYNFIYDNCATRPRDIILKAIDGKVEYHLVPDQHTFRDWVEMYIGKDTWVMFAIDMVFGQDADVIATRKESMFLPEVLMTEFQQSIITEINTPDTCDLISEYQILNQELPEEKKIFPFIISPVAACSLLLLVGLGFTFLGHRLRFSGKIFDTVIFVIAGLVGLVVFYLMFFSLHPMVKNNLNILWLNPLLLIAAVTQWFSVLRSVTVMIQIINAILLFVALAVFALSMQYINIAFIPLILLLTIRILNYLRSGFNRYQVKTREKHAKQSLF